MAMSTAAPADDIIELRCIECDRPVTVERELIDPPYVVCTNCEARVNDVFWQALHRNQDDSVEHNDSPRMA